MVSWQSWKNQAFGALLLGAAAVPALAADPVLSFTASPNPVQVGSALTVDVVVTGVTDLFAHQFSLSFNPAVLQATGVTEGAFLPTGGITFFGPGSINNAAGTLSFAFDTLVGAVPGVSGTGVLARLSFDTLAAGSSALTFADVILLDSALADITVQLQNASVQVVVVPEPATALLFALGLAGLAGARRRLTSTV